MTFNELRKRMYHADVKGVGYWRASEDDCSPTYIRETKHLPNPNDLVRREPWDAEKKAQILAYLNHPGHMRVAFRGSSTCRVCGMHGNGHEDVSDGVWRWPSGLGHYVEAHDVDLPLGFLEHIERVRFKGTA